MKTFRRKTRVITIALIVAAYNKTNKQHYKQNLIHHYYYIRN